MRVRVLAFARLRELLGSGTRELELADSANVEHVWALLAGGTPALAPYRASTRFARNGVLVEPGAPVHDGDEIALMPPVGGG